MVGYLQKEDGWISRVGGWVDIYRRNMGGYLEKEVGGYLEKRR